MIKYFKPFITQQCDDFFSIIDSGWLTTGPYVAELEEKWADLCKSRYAVAVSSASAGLHIALLANNIKYKMVFTTDYTYIATYLAACYDNFVRLVDIDDQYNMDSESMIQDSTAQGYFTSRDCAFLPVHIGGSLFDVNKLKPYGKWIIEDCAHRWPGEHEGNCQVYSLYANKLITSAEGGIVTTDDKSVYKRLKELRYQGRTKTNHFDYDVTSIGYKYNMPDVLAAIALAQLPYIEWNKKERHKIVNKYVKAFGELNLGMQKYSEDHSYHLFLLRFDSKEMREFVTKKIEKHIETSRHYKPLSTMTLLKNAERPKPRAIDYYERTMSLPIYPTLTELEVDEIIDRISNAVYDWRLIHGEKK